MIETGVYKITNTVTGKFYIGSTTETFHQRWTHHKRKLKTGKHANRHLQASWKKYGSSVFLFEVVEECEIEVCRVREQHYLDTLTPWKKGVGYNLGKVATNGMEGRN